MTYDKHEEIHFLKVLLDRTISDKKNFFLDELIDAVRIGKMHPDRANELFWIFRDKEYIDEQDDPSPIHLGTKLYSISDGGKDYLKYLEEEIKHEEIDRIIKKQTIASTRFSRNVAYVSLLVALLAAFIPFVIWWVGKDGTQKTSTEIPQLQQVIQVQQQLQQNVQDLQKTIQTLDTSVKKIRIVNK